MARGRLPGDLRGLHIFLVGAKGTGMTALAEILASKGARLSGSDVADPFYTDRILAELGVDLAVGFEASLLPAGCGLVIHSAAYPRDSNPQLLEAARRGLGILSYPEALGDLSRRQDSSAIAGVHGKTTTTALAGTFAQALGLPATILAGSAVAAFGGRSTRNLGDGYLIAETCEYRRHFLNYAPARIVLTSIEPDHQDCYPALADIRAAFDEFIALLPHGGRLIYCADDEGARGAALAAKAVRTDLDLVPYGEGAAGPYRMSGYKAGEGLASFALAGFDGRFELRVPGRHIALDATAALALCLSLPSRGRAGIDRADSAELAAARSALLSFSGSKRRSEFVGEEGGVMVVDDYGHHPTAIARTLEGLREFWPGRRLVVDFMSHTYSRTRALFPEFAASLDAADLVMTHRIYPSAREAVDPSVDGEALAAAIRARGSLARHLGRVSYVGEPLDALPLLLDLLEPGDLFLTLGAGDNWKLGPPLLEALAGRRKAG